MDITNIRYSRTVQAAQYEPELLEAHAIMEEGDDFETCAAELRKRVTAVLRGKTVGASTSSNKSGEKGKAEEAGAESASETTTKPKPPKKKASTRKKKPIVYNREVKAHQTEMGKILTEVCPDWKGSDDTKGKAKKASVDLCGDDFMDADGKVLGSFVDLVRTAMAEDEL